MSKEVFLVFQDCPYCEPRTKWGERQMDLARKHNIVVREVSYDHPGAPALIDEAKNHGVATLPFFTDGDKFAYDLSAFIKERVPAPKDDEVIEPEKKTAKRSTHKKAVEKVETDDPVGQD